MKRQLTDKKLQMSVKHMKRCPTFFLIRKMQIESAKMSFFKKPIRLAKTQV